MENQNSILNKDENYNIFKFDTSLTPEDKTVTLTVDRRGDKTSWDCLTDWGDGAIDNATSHAYTNDGIYLVKTKYILDESNNKDNNTRKKLIDCININKNIKDCNNMFRNCINVVEFSSTDWNTTNVTNMNAMFAGCTNLTTLDVSNWNTSNVTNMSCMLFNCNNLTTLDVSKWNTSNVTDMDWMFYNCNKLTILDVSKWNTSNLKYMYNMFNWCSSLTLLGVSNWDTSNVISDLFFRKCK